MIGSPLMHHTGRTIRTTDPLGSTSLKWSEDGELSELDLTRILKMLSQADPVAESLIRDRFETEVGSRSDSSPF